MMHRCERKDPKILKAELSKWISSAAEGKALIYIDEKTKPKY